MSGVNKMKRILLSIVFCLAFSRYAICSDHTVVSHKGSGWSTELTIVLPLPSDVEAIKDGIVYFRKGDKCFACVIAMSHFRHLIPSITEVTCTPEIK